MKIITDSAALYSSEEESALGVTVIPACVIIDNRSYRDFEDIRSEEFLELIARGKTPTSSQPSIGEVMEAFEETKEEILFLGVGDGLSGTYQNAMGAKNSIDNNSHIHVLDTRTLAGAQRCLVQKALKLREAGQGIEKIKQELQKSIETSVSFVIPEDFQFLKRSGRLTPIAAKISSLIKIVPVLTQTADKARIEVFAIKRSWKRAVEAIIERLKALGVDESYRISIGHAGGIEKAKEVLEQIKVSFAHTETELLALSPSLITHGGPGCVTIQAIRK